MDLPQHIRKQLMTRKL